MKKNRELPDDMPFHPDRTYKNKGWVNWGHFLGTNRVANSAKQFRNFEQARKYIQQEGVASGEQYREMKTNGNCQMMCLIIQTRSTKIQSGSAGGTS